MRLTAWLPLRIALIVRGRLDPGFKQVSNDGWTSCAIASATTPELFEAIIAEG